MYVPKPRPLSDTEMRATQERGFPPAPSSRLLPAARPLQAKKSSPARALALVVESEGQGRDTFAAYVQSAGHEAVCASALPEALDALKSRSFDLLLCDICLLEQDGMALLIETALLYPEMPVILITEAETAARARAALEQGAGDVIARSCAPGELALVLERNLTRSALQRKYALRYRLALETSQESLLDALLTALNTREAEWPGHAERVTAYTMELAGRMGMSPNLGYHLERGALMHDIGKIGIPDSILHKPGKLTEAEWAEIRKHPVLGYQMCAPIEMLQQAAPIVLHHHEWWNGSGYPNGLAGNAIPLEARIFAIADALDALTSDRPYRAARPFSAAREEIVQQSGHQFDPALVAVFLTIPESRWLHIRTQAAR